MALSDLVIPKQSISVGDMAFDVRGLCLNDLTRLYHLHGDKLDEVVQLYTGAEDDRSKDEDVIQVLIKRLPDVVYSAAALAADEPDQADSFAKLPLPIQIETVKAIWRLTVEDAGGTKKFIQSLIELFQSTSNGIREL
jgi:hypothetical protein